VGRAAVFPVLMIGLSLIYFDQRVRKEALDLVMMMGGQTSAPTPDWNPAPQAAPVWPPLNSAVTPAAEPTPAAQNAVQSPEEDAGHANDAPVA